MPAFEKLGKTDCAVRWPVGTVPDEYGRDQRGRAEEIAVRWDDTPTRQTDAQGNSIMLPGTVLPSKSLELGDVLYRGSLAQYKGLISTAVPDLVEIVRDDSSKDIKGRGEWLEYAFQRFRGTLPTLES